MKSLIHHLSIYPTRTDKFIPKWDLSLEDGVWLLLYLVNVWINCISDAISLYLNLLIVGLNLNFIRAPNIKCKIQQSNNDFVEFIESPTPGALITKNRILHLNKEKGDRLSLVLWYRYPTIQEISGFQLNNYFPLLWCLRYP